MWYGTRFRAEHVFQMRVQPAQAGLKHYFFGRRIEENEWSATLMDDGEPIAIVLVAPTWETRAVVGALLSDRITAKNFWPLHDLARKYLAALPFKRLEATVAIGFTQGHRWVKALGFQQEAKCMKSFDIDGSDAALYALVRP